MKRFAILFVLLLITLPVLAQESEVTVPKDSQELIDLVGLRSSKVFGRYGTPVSMYVERGSTAANDWIVFDYNQYGFKFHENLIREVVFFPQWKGNSIKGLTMDMTRDDVLGKMGTPYEDKKFDDGSERITYSYPDYYLDSIFNKDHQLIRIIFFSK